MARPSYDLKTDFSDEEADQADLGFAVLLEEYLPVKVAGTIPAAFEMYRDPSAILAKAGAAQGAVFGVTFVAALLLAVLLTLVFRSADRRLKRQTRELVEATRRDALTGTLNHGAVVAALAADIEAAEATSGGLVALALIDIDNFRLLNDTHGHEAGDVALKRVTDLLIAEAPTGSTIGRYGPDEMLLVTKGESVAELQAAVSSFRTRLGEVALQFGASEPLPVTVSAGAVQLPDARSLGHRAAHPSRGRAVTGARQRWRPGACRGDGRGRGGRLGARQLRRPAGPRHRGRHQGPLHQAALRGRGALRRCSWPTGWACRQSGVAPCTSPACSTTSARSASPTPSCASPDRSRTSEHAIVQQHVALGHMIVRDLPHLELVRAGVRFHHERWDGGGYLEGLHGRGHPARGAHPGGRRCVLGDDHVAALSQGVGAARGARPARGRRRVAARSASW